MKQLFKDNERLTKDLDQMLHVKEELNTQLNYSFNQGNLAQDDFNNQLNLLKNEIKNIKSVNESLLNDQNIKEEVIESLSSSNQRLNDNIISHQAEITDLKSKFNKIKVDLIKAKNDLKTTLKNNEEIEQKLICVENLNQD